MLEPLYEKTITRKREINNFFNNIQNNIDTKKIKNEYHEHEFNQEKQEKTLAAIDGSFNKIKFMACFVYAIDSQTIVSDPKKGLTKESSTGDINIISSTRSRTIDNILSMHMNILELKSTIDTLQRFPDIDYMLMDGTLRGTLMNFSTNYDLDEFIKGYLDRISSQIDKIISNKNFPLEVTTITHKNEILYETEKELKDKGSDIDIHEIEDEVLRYYEGLEQLCCINYLLENFKDKIICISKTSSTKSFFNENIPDAAAIEYTCKNPGYTNIKHETTNKLVRHINENKVVLIDYPIHKSTFSNTTYSICYARLSKRSNILKIEIPHEIKKDDYATIENILNDLYSASIDGYPYILKKAHNEVIIKHKDMKNIVNKLEVMEKTGRDMLN